MEKFIVKKIILILIKVIIDQGRNMFINVMMREG